MKTNNDQSVTLQARATRSARQSRRAFIGLDVVRERAPEFSGLGHRLRCEAHRCRKEAIFYHEAALTERSAA